MRTFYYSKPCDYNKVVKPPRFVLLLLFAFASLQVFAQDIHFSQSYNTPFYLNPALTGIFKGDIRYAGAYRSQWKAALAPYSTVYAGADRKFLSAKNGGKKFVSAGFYFNYDQAGDGQLTNIQLALNGSYSIALDKENLITFGALAGVNQRSFDLNALSFDSQFNGDIFDPNGSINENFNSERRFYPDFGAGVNWHGQKSESRSTVDVGAAVFHFHQPDQSYIGVSSKSPLRPRFSVYIHPTVQVTNKVDILIHGMSQLQDSYLQALAGGAIRYHLNTKKGQNLALQVGAGYRFNAVGDAFIPAVELHYKGWQAGFSYDVNVSKYNNATNRNGGPEFTLRHIITTVKPLKYFKFCPLI